MMTSQTITASEFKATCLELFDRLAERKLDRLIVTKRGKPVAVLTPPPPARGQGGLYGAMRGRAHIAEGVNLSEVGVDVEVEAETGEGWAWWRG